MRDGSSGVSALPFLTAGRPEVPGEIRARPEDFRVEEVPAYTPSGEGTHLYVRFEKTGLGTPAAVERIAAALGVSARDSGWAGLKDRHAVTTQWASFPCTDAAPLATPIEGVRVLEHGLHGNKLRTGHLRGNRFVILVRGAPAERAEDVRAALGGLARRGVPNYFGEQRFGRDGSNLVAARRWLIEGGRAPRKPFARKLYVSALQSALFNELLAERISEGSMDGVVQGDLLRKEDTGGLFVSEEPEVDRARAAEFAVSATGPMFGDRMRWPEGEALRREEATLARWQMDRDTLARFRRAGSGTRRPYRVRIDEASVEPTGEGLLVSFALPSGAYATVVLRELLHRTVT